MGFTLFLAVLTIVGNLLADVLYASGRSAYSGEVMMILSYLASRRRQRQAAIPALAHITPLPGAGGWRQLRRNRLAMFCLLLLAVMAVWCVLGPVWSPWSDDATDALSINQPPGAEHWLGTDFLGRDVYTRLLLAGRISLVIGLLTMVMSVCLGYLLGALSGYVGGLTDKLIMRVADPVMTIPRVTAIDRRRGDAFRARFFAGLAHLYGGGDAQPAGVAPTGAAGARAMSLPARTRFYAGHPGCWACRRVAGCLATCCRIPFRFWW